MEVEEWRGVCVWRLEGCVWVEGGVVELLGRPTSQAVWLWTRSRVVEQGEAARVEVLYTYRHIERPPRPEEFMHTGGAAVCLLQVEAFIHSSVKRFYELFFSRFSGNN